jgi:hypothetical protein
MMGRPKFDEVMIVNPSNVNSDQKVRLMRFHNIYPPEVSGFAQPDPYGYYGGPQAYGYYGEPEQYGYYAQEPYLSEDPTYVDPTYGYYGQVDPAYVDPTYGYYGQVDPNYGYYAQVDPTYGYYAQEPEFAGVGAWDGYGYGQYPEPGPVGYYAQEAPVANYNQPQAPMGYYGQVPETVGYSEPQRNYTEEYPNVGYYGEPDYSGYTREVASPFNPGCPLPTNVSGFDDGGFAGYARPATVNPSCEQFTDQPGSPAAAPDTFKPLW